MQVLALVALFMISNFAFAVNKCTINGNIIYQQSPCPAGSGAEIKIDSTRLSENPNLSGLRESERKALEAIQNRAPSDPVPVAPSSPRTINDLGATDRRDLGRHCDEYNALMSSSFRNSIGYKEDAHDELMAVEAILAKNGLARPDMGRCSARYRSNCYAKMLCEQM